MQAEEIGLLLKQERGQFLEFISAYEYRRGGGQKKTEEELAREIVRVLSGMANADGGTFLVGVEPDNSVTGIPHDHDELQTLIQSPQNMLRPPLNPACEKVRLGNLQLLKFEVAVRAGDLSRRRRPVVLPHRRRDAVAAGGTNSALKEAKKSVFYERQQALNATWFDLDADLVQEFVKKTHDGQDPPERAQPHLSFARSLARAPLPQHGGTAAIRQRSDALASTLPASTSSNTKAPSGSTAARSTSSSAFASKLRWCG